MSFLHSPYHFDQLVEKTASNGYRVYTTPDGSVYPSVTSVLKDMNKDSIKAWRERVGAEEANKIVAKAANRGKYTEALINLYLRNEEPVITNPFTLFHSMKPELDKHLTLVNNLQAPLYSHKLKIAGTCDIIGNWDGVPSIIDLKTSLRQKHEDWIKNYFFQVTLYAMMFYELTGIPIKQTVIFIGIDLEYPQVFINPVSKYIKEVYIYLKEHNPLFKK
jgi:hypothetical protein